LSNNPFDWLNSINHKKEDIMVDDEAEKGYSQFMVARGLSYFQDTVLLANEMNIAPGIDNRMHYDFLRTAVRPRKRFSKWMKKTVADKNEVIKEYYGYSDAKAESVADLISDEDVKHMKAVLSKGGKKR
jgi:hypothetical protein